MLSTTAVASTLIKAVAKPTSLRAVAVPAISALSMTARSLATISPDLPLARPARQQKNQRQQGVSPFPTSFTAQPPTVEPPQLPALFRLRSGQTFNAVSFGAPVKAPVSGEVVFTTSIVGYPESMTDPSYRGQILVFTQPLIGNYGVPSPTTDQWGLLDHFESNQIQVKAIIVNDYATKYSHWNAIESLGQWCARNGVAALSGVDTRAIVTILRDNGSTLGDINIGDAALKIRKDTPIFEDPNTRNLCAEVSTKTKVVYGKGLPLKVALLDMGVKHNIIRCLVNRGVEVHLVPWDHDLVADKVKYDGVFLSNGPGDPRHCTKTVNNLRALMNSPAHAHTPIFGICMGNQILGMAAGYGVYKLPYGNRGHNQPALDLLTGKCVITSQNHGYALDDAKMVPGWVPYFRNANDGSNEGIRHMERPWRSVQFHPEAKGGPMDTEYLFGDFVDLVKKNKASKISVAAAAAQLQASV